MKYKKDANFTACLEAIERYKKVQGQNYVKVERKN